MSRAESKKWGFESEFTRKARAKQLRLPQIERCGLCGVTAPTATSVGGISWFKRHERTRQHKAALAKRQQDGS